MDAVAMRCVYRKFFALDRAQLEEKNALRGRSPEHVVDASFGNVSLVGYDIDSGEVTAGGTVHLRLYWRLGWPGRYFVSTRIGDTPYVETHELGFGNIDRYTRTLGTPSADALLVEEYDLVVLSSVGEGEQPIRVRLSSGPFAQERNIWLDLGTVSVRSR